MIKLPIGNILELFNPLFGRLQHVAQTVGRVRLGIAEQRVQTVHPSADPRVLGAGHPQFDAVLKVAAVQRQRGAPPLVYARHYFEASQTFGVRVVLTLKQSIN